MPHPLLVSLNSAHITTSSASTKVFSVTPFARHLFPTGTLSDIDNCWQNEGGNQRVCAVRQVIQTHTPRHTRTPGGLTHTPRYTHACQVGRHTPRHTHARWAYTHTQTHTHARLAYTHTQIHALQVGIHTHPDTHACQVGIHTHPDTHALQVGICCTGCTLGDTPVPFLVLLRVALFLLYRVK